MSASSANIEQCTLGSGSPSRAISRSFFVSLSASSIVLFFINSVSALPHAIDAAHP